MPAYVNVVEELVLIVPLLVIVIPLLLPNEKVPEVFNVPPVKIILSPSAEPGVAPILLIAEITIVPADKFVEPV